MLCFPTPRPTGPVSFPRAHPSAKSRLRPLSPSPRCLPDDTSIGWGGSALSTHPGFTSSSQNVSWALTQTPPRRPTTQREAASCPAPQGPACLATVILASLVSCPLLPGPSPEARPLLTPQGCPHLADPLPGTLPSPAVRPTPRALLWLLFVTAWFFLHPTVT